MFYTSERPIRWDHAEDLQRFFDRNAAVKIIDRYDELLKDLFLIRHPPLRFKSDHEAEWTKFLRDHLEGVPMERAGEWFYFPWNKMAVHYLADTLHQELRTARNKNLITIEEQTKFYNATVGIAGLSVGSHAALTLVMMGGTKVLKLADGDILSGSNLNRVRYDFSLIGESKCAVAARLIYQINPYAIIHMYPSGLSLANIDEFFSGEQKLDIFIEEMDNLDMKISARLAAKLHHVPLLMATDNGDNIIVDIERYDLNEDLQIFNGAVGNLTLEDFQNLSPQEIPKLAAKIVGPELIVPRMMSSLGEVGKTLYSWPQLGDAASLCGVTLAYLVRKIILGENIKDGKLEVNLDKIFYA